MSGRKRIKKYNAGGFTGMSPLGAGLSQFGGAAGGFIQQEDMADGNYSHMGAFGSNALKGASMGAALGPWGAAAGAAIGGIYGLVTRDARQEELDKQAEQERMLEQRRENELKMAEQEANDAILEQYPVKGVAQPRFELGGSTIGDPTDPKKKKNTIWDAPLNAKRLAMHEDVLPALTKLNEDEITLMIDKSIEMDELFKGKTNAEKLEAFKEMDMSWIKPLREKTGLTKSQIIDAAGESGALKKWAVAPVKAASLFMDFAHGGPTGPEAKADINLAAKHGMDFRNETPSLYDLGHTGPVTMRPDMLLNAAAGVKGAQAVYNAGKLTLGQLLQKGVTAQQLRRRAMGEVLGKEVGLQGAESVLTGFGMGGSTLPQYKAEGGEMIQHQAGDVPMTDNNGDLNRMTETEAEIKGDKHSAASGGVGMSDKKGARIYSDQLTVDKGLAAKLSKL